MIGLELAIFLTFIAGFLCVLEVILVIYFVGWILNLIIGPYVED